MSRSIYALAADIEPGSSGGPLITTKGAVARVVFAKSVTQDDVGYALIWSEAAADVGAVSQRSEAVPTGTCTPGNRRGAIPERGTRFAHL